MPFIFSGGCFVETGNADTVELHAMQPRAMAEFAFRHKTPSDEDFSRCWRTAQKDAWRLYQSPLRHIPHAGFFLVISSGHRGKIVHAQMNCDALCCGTLL